MTGLTFMTASLCSWQPALAAGEEWSLSLTASTATMGTNPNLVLGTNVSATSGFDAGIDVPTAPPPPPPVDLAAYFPIDDTLFNKLDGDYRAPDTSIQWKLKASSEEAILLTWDTGDVPANIALHLTGAGLDIDMNVVSHTELPAEGSYTLIVTATTTSTETSAISTPTPTAELSATPTPTATSASGATPTPTSTSAMEPTPTSTDQGDAPTQTVGSADNAPESSPTSTAGTADNSITGSPAEEKSTNWAVIGMAISAGLVLVASTIWTVIRRRR